MLFKEIKKGLFRFHGIVYSKINDAQAVLITSGEICEFNSEDKVEPW